MHAFIVPKCNWNTLEHFEAGNGVRKCDTRFSSTRGNQDNEQLRSCIVAVCQSYNKLRQRLSICLSALVRSQFKMSQSGSWICLYYVLLAVGNLEFEVRHEISNYELSGLHCQLQLTFSHRLPTVSNWSFRGLVCSILRNTLAGFSRGNDAHLGIVIMMIYQVMITWTGYHWDIRNCLVPINGDARFFDKILWNCAHAS